MQIDFVAFYANIALLCSKIRISTFVVFIRILTQYLPLFMKDFGLDEDEFKKQFCSECPEPFFRLAFQACATNPENR